MAETKDETKQVIPASPEAAEAPAKEAAAESTEPKVDTEDQELETLGNTKKRSDGNGTTDPNLRKRRKRRQYDEAPKEEPESEEEAENDKEANVQDDDEDDEEDNLGGVDVSNIIAGGRRTRGKKIDYKKANEEVPLDDEDEEEDGEFEDKGDEEE